MYGSIYPDANLQWRKLLLANITRRQLVNLIREMNISFDHKTTFTYNYMLTDWALIE